MWVAALILAFVLLLLSLRISVAVQYDQVGVLVRLGIGPIRLKLYPRRSKKE